MTQTSHRRKKFSRAQSQLYKLLAVLFGLVSLFLLGWLAQTFVNRPVLRVTSLQTGKNSVLTARVENVGTITAADPAFAVDPSENMLVMKLTVKNTSSQKQHFIPVTQLYIRSGEGDYSALHPSSHVARPLPATDLYPNQSVSGEISFVIPKRLATPLLYVDTGWDSAAPIVVDVFH